MAIQGRMRLLPDEEVKIYEGVEGDTYEKALLSFGINPDSVLILSRGTSIPQDSEIREDQVEIVCIW